MAENQVHFLSAMSRLPRTFAWLSAGGRWFINRHRLMRTAADHIPKPVDHGQLFNTLLKWPAPAPKENA